MNDTNNLDGFLSISSIRNMPNNIHKFESKDEKDIFFANRFNNSEGSLAYYDCHKCKNKGTYISFKEDGKPEKNENGEFIYKRCECMNIRDTKKMLHNSGLEDLVKIYTLENYKVNTEWQKKYLNCAYSFLKNDNKWFYIGGISGSGKTQLCTGIVGKLIEKNLPTYYMVWSEKASMLIQMNFDNSVMYQDELDKIKNIKVLYIDDFLKPFNGETKPNIQAIRLAFEIINARYNKRMTDLKTIISSEYTISKIIDLDTATGGRIYEMSKPYVLSPEGTDKNCRIHSELTK